MTPEERRTLLERWIQPSSDSEQDRQDRACRMVEDAIRRHPAFSTTSIAVYAKGSYANQTNVRLDSDVDIVVENRSLFYWDYLHPEWSSTHVGSPYTGPWTPDRWRTEVENAIVAAFGRSEVDTSGSVALNIKEKPGSRPSTDVVPAFEYHRYDKPDRSIDHQGSKVFKKTSGSVVNWPNQQLVNGETKNRGTAGRYKQFVRALKNAENTLVNLGLMKAKPSYLMECLVYNVPDSTLRSGTLETGFGATLAWLHDHLNAYQHDEWLEPNRLKWLFHSIQKWTVDDARSVVSNTILYLYGE